MVVHHGIILQKELQKRGVNAEEFAEILNCSKSKAYQWRNKKIFGREQIAMLYMLFGIHPEKFPLPNNSQLNFKYSTIIQADSLKKFLCSSYLSHHGTTKDDFLNEYYKSINECLEDAQEKVWMYDYYHSNNVNIISDRIIKEEFRGHHTFLRQIEKRLREEPMLEFNRVIALPLFKEDYFESKVKLTPLEQAIRLSFVHTIKHIWECLKEFEKRYNLFVIETPPRIYCVMLIDNKYVVTEKFKFTQKDFANPDILKVERILDGNHVSKLHRVYTKEISSAININQTAIHKKKVFQSDMKRATFGLITKIESSINDLKKILSSLDMMDEKYSIYERKIEEMENERLLAQEKFAVMN